MVNIKKNIKSKEVCEITGCTHRQLQYWEKKEYITPLLGNRNLRYYSEKDIELIQKIISLKKKGKSLGEAFAKSNLKLTVEETIPKPTLSNAAGIIKKLEQEWLELNNQLLSNLKTIQKLENSIPKFPYSIYYQTDIDKLKILQDEAVSIKKKKDSILKELEKNTQTKIVEEDNPKTKSEPIQAPDALEKNTSPYLVDQLVILWMRKNNTQNIAEARSSISKRIQAGEKIENIAEELKNYITSMANQ